MRFILGFFFLTAAANAATTLNTTMTVTNAAVSVGTSVTLNGPVTLSGIGSGTFAATASLSSFTGTNVTANFTITLTTITGTTGATNDTITGTLSVPGSVFVGGATSGTGSATITGGTGAFVNATGSFPSLNGTTSGTFPTNLTLSVTGSGTVVTGGPGLPHITSVGDSASYGQALAQGGLITVKGTSLSPSGFFQQGFPLPMNAQNVKATLTPAAGGTGTDLYILYLYNQNNLNQLALIVPSSVSPGSYNLTVTNNGAVSPPMQVTVVKTAPGIFTQDSTGTGLAVVQNYISATQLDVNRATTFAANGYTYSPARPGQVLIAWATNLGAVPGGDNVASAGYDFTKNGHTVNAIVGGTKVPATYAGPSPGLAGSVSQVNFSVPAGITGCAIEFEIEMDGVSSSPTFINIAATGADACVHPVWTRSQLINFDQQNGNYRWGQAALEQFSENIPNVGNQQIGEVSVLFQEDNAFHLGIPLTQIITNITTAQCLVSVTTTTGGSSGQGPLSIFGGINRDSGTVTLTGPSGSNFNKTVIPQQSDLSYILSTAGNSGVNLVPGSYTAAGAGGTPAFPGDPKVGPWSVTGTLAAGANLTNLPTSVPKNSDLTITFPSSNGYVEASVSSSATSGAGATATTTSGSVTCVGPANGGTITLPGTDLSQLPSSSNAFLSVFIGNSPVSFKAPGTDGNGDFNSLFVAASGTQQGVSLQ